jgi:hypothetical protein
MPERQSLASIGAQIHSLTRARFTLATSCSTEAHDYGAEQERSCRETPWLEQIANLHTRDRVRWLRGLLPPSVGLSQPPQPGCGVTLPSRCGGPRRERRCCMVTSARRCSDDSHAFVVLVGRRMRCLWDCELRRFRKRPRRLRYGLGMYGWRDSGFGGRGHSGPIGWDRRLAGGDKCWRSVGC